LRYKSLIRKICLVSIVVILALFTSTNVHRSIQKAEAESRDECSPLDRPHHVFRHWQWSGIFPFEGGWMPDPYCNASVEKDLPASALKEMKKQRGTYQIIEVNPGFNDDSSEVVLYLRVDGQGSEYNLSFPSARGVVAVLAIPDDPRVQVFVLDHKIYLLANFSGPAKGIYVLPSRLENKGRLELHDVSSREFKDVASRFHEVAEQPEVRDRFCHSTLDFSAYYERYAGSCGWDKKLYEINPAVHDYDGFWLKSQ